MAKVREIINIIEELFPPQNVCMEDSIGLMLGSEDSDVEKALLCLDCSQEVIEEAKAKNAQLVISHHPFIFHGIDVITQNSLTGSNILLASKYGINVFSAHTNMDCSEGGIGSFYAEILNLKNADFLIKNQNGQSGIGIIGDLENEIGFSNFKELLKKEIDDPYIKPYGREKIIKRVAIINGSGGDEESIIEAKSKGADVLVTAEIKHHIALLARFYDLNLLDFSHYASEHIFMEKLKKTLTEKLKKQNIKIELTVAESESNPAL